jgi:hypothetical protein
MVFDYVYGICTHAFAFPAGSRIARGTTQPSRRVVALHAARAHRREAKHNSEEVDLLWLQPSEPMSEEVEEDGNWEVKKLKKECAAMIQLLKSLEKEEQELRVQNEILAREALLNGFAVGLLEPPAPKRRKISVAKKSESTHP